MRRAEHRDQRNFDRLFVGFFILPGQSIELHQCQHLIGRDRPSEGTGGKDFEDLVRAHPDIAATLLETALTRLN